MIVSMTLINQFKKFLEAQNYDKFLLIKSMILFIYQKRLRVGSLKVTSHSSNIPHDDVDFKQSSPKAYTYMQIGNILCQCSLHSTLPSFFEPLSKYNLTYHGVKAYFHLPLEEDSQHKDQVRSPISPLSSSPKQGVGVAYLAIAISKK